MEHPHADLVRRAFVAFEHGDEATVRELFHPDIRWWVGHRELVGLDAVLADFARILDLTGGDYRAEPRDFLGSDSHAIALTRAVASRADGRRLAVDQAVIFSVSDGRLVECHHVAYDEATWDAFFA